MEAVEEQAQSQKLRRDVESQIDAIVREIAKELRSCFHNRRTQTISGLTPHLDVMAGMGLIDINHPIEPSTLLRQLMCKEYEPTDKAHEVYDGLVAEGYYRDRGM